MSTFEQRILDALPNVVCAVDLEGRITAINRLPARVTAGGGGLPASNGRESIGATVHELFADVVSDEQLDHAMQTLRTGRAPQVSWESSRDDGSALLFQVVPLLNGASVSGFCFSLIDISPVHQVREALIDSGLALARVAGLDRVFQEIAHQARRVIPADSLAIALADEQTAELRLAHLTGFPDANAANEARLQSAWNEALVADHVVLSTSSSGTELTAPIRGAEGVIGAMTVVADRLDGPHEVAEASRALAMLSLQAGAAIEHAWLARAAEQKRRLEAIGEISAGIAQELRNPLFGISSAAQLLRFRAKDDPVIETNVGRILREAERMHRLSTALLEYGRPNPVRLTPADPDAIWDEVLESERGRLETSAIAVTRKRARPPARCAIDPDQLGQVFINVLINALDAAPEASDISLVTEVLPTGAWRCRLRNGGPPVAPDALARAFELFFSTKPGAAGLGLPICQRIVEEHGGTIALESTPDAGTTVSIVLPPAA